jgi:DNA-binding transcriptional LysR family regulator
MNMTFKQLRYATTAGRLGSIAAAAAELNISQSSITAAIDSLEQVLGLDLFIRLPAKGIVPTPEGRNAIAMMQQMLDQVALFEAEFLSLSGSPHGFLRLGCYVTAAPYVLPPTLRAFSQSYPQARIDLREGDLMVMTDLLVAGEIDLAMTYRDYVTAELEFHPLFDARPYALISKEDPLSKAGTVSLHDLAKRPMVLLELPLTREYFNSIFETVGTRPNIVHSSRSSEIVRALVAGGFGVSILNISSGYEDFDGSGYRCLPIAEPVDIPEFGIVAVKGVRRPVMSQAFIEICGSLRRDGVFEGMTVPMAGKIKPKK